MSTEVMHHFVLITYTPQTKLGNKADQQVITMCYRYNKAHTVTTASSSPQNIIYPKMQHMPMAPAHIHRKPSQRYTTAQSSCLQHASDSTHLKDTATLIRESHPIIHWETLLHCP